MLGLSDIHVQDTHSGDENRHLRCGQHQQLRPVDQQLLRCDVVFRLEVVAESVCSGLERGEGVDIRLLLSRIRATRRERNRHIASGVLRGLFDTRASCQDDQVGKRNRFPVRNRTVELLLDGFKCLQHGRQLLRLVGFPVFLRCQADACPVRTSPHVGTAEG